MVSLSLLSPSDWNNCLFFFGFDDLDTCEDYRLFCTVSLSLDLSDVCSWFISGYTSLSGILQKCAHLIALLSVWHYTCWFFICFFIYWIITCYYHLFWYSSLNWLVRAHFKQDASLHVLIIQLLNTLIAFFLALSFFCLIYSVIYSMPFS